MRPKSKSSHITVRLTDDVRYKFLDKAEEVGTTPSEVLRELIDAFCEDRITLQPAVNRNRPLEKLYVTRSED
jgi:hypothetical protein